MTTALSKTSIHPLHVQAGARMVPFAGFEMPVQYVGVIDEHLNVRANVGLFDVSHMGEVELRGPRALEIADRIVSQDMRSIRDGQAAYAVMCREDGGIIDDVVVHRFSTERVFVCVNAANRAKDFEWMRSFAGPGCDIRDVSDDYAQIAVQGPKSVALLKRLTDAPLDDLKRYHFLTDSTLGNRLAGQGAGRESIIARTGYTGEDGFEIYCQWVLGPTVWSALLETGRDLGVGPAGLGARDSLRLEMRYALYGNDIDESTDPLEAGLGWVVKLNKASDFVGKEALEKKKAAPSGRTLVGFEMKGRGIGRPHYPIVRDGRRIGEVTSGTMGPSVQKAIGMGYVPVEFSKIGTALEIEIRGKPVIAEVVETPFYKPDRIPKAGTPRP